MSTTALFALFLVSAFTLYPSSTTAQFIVDTDGEPVRNGGSYYVLPLIWSLGGGLGLGQTGNETCPLSVVQTLFRVSNGLPLEISSPYRLPFLMPGHRLDLSFTIVPTCATTPSKWTVVKGLSEQPLVKVTGYENTIEGAFVIQHASSKVDIPNTYKFQFCQFNSVECENIGIVKGDKNDRLLAVISKEDLEFPFVLVKAQTSSSSV